MSIATTPSQIKKECSGVPTCGTVVLIDSRNDCLEFVVAMDQGRLIDLLKDLVARRKAWSPEIMKTIVRTTPTCPLPKNPVRELNHIVRFIPNKDTIMWTSDNWVTTNSCAFHIGSKYWTNTVLTKG